ncbi:MAG: hypothetical protein A3208_04750 [Candidatus Methanoprimaticola hominis]|nr:MAG: hypothetical protein A3208_04750 [Methanomassiliicoccales archaeon Mx-06]
MEVGDLLKYTPTSTVGKVTDIRERDGKAWVRLDFTDLYYDASLLIPADPSEYIEVSFKERRSYDGGRQAIEDIRKEAEDVDVSEFMPSGGG